VVLKGSHNSTARAQPSLSLLCLRARFAGAAVFHGYASQRLIDVKAACVGRRDVRRLSVRGENRAEQNRESVSLQRERERERLGGCVG
jgi:hypothetical protein